MDKPSEDIVPMTELERRIFEEDMNFFFDTLFQKMEDGAITTDRAEAFFPEEVRARNKS